MLSVDTATPAHALVKNITCICALFNELQVGADVVAGALSKNFAVVSLEFY